MKNHVKSKDRGKLFPDNLPARLRVQTLHDAIALRISPATDSNRRSAYTVDPRCAPSVRKKYPRTLLAWLIHERRES